ncbi:MAG: cation-translocating P-type ATPase [Anaerolineae bacterium]
MNWYQQSPTEVTQHLDVDSALGLSGSEAQRRLAEHGPNELIDRGAKNPWKILWEQFTATMVLILIAAAVVSVLVGDAKDAIVIMAIVALFGLLGFVQEYRAEQAMAALRKMSVPSVKVRRDGDVREVSATQLVPGDIVLLEAGNVVPADARLLEATNLRIQEAALTGESEPIEKQTDALRGEDLPLGDRRNLAYMGTIVTYGRGLALIVATGMQTELGRIADLIQDVKDELTPLQRRLDRLGKTIGVIALIVAALIFGLGLLRGEDWRLMIMTAISVAVAAVPEGLPAVVTITLALGAKRMLKRNALIRKLPAVETLGSVTVICSDKTGTLTENRMTVTVLDVAGHRVDVTENMSRKMPVIDEVAQPVETLSPALSLLLTGGALCNDAALQAETGGQFHTLGDPTEGALLVAAAKYNLWKHDLDRALPRVGEVPFDSDRKRMTTVHAIDKTSSTALLTAGSAPYVAFVKGSVDGLLALSNRVWVNDAPIELTDEYRDRIEIANHKLAQNGMRVLGVAMRPIDSAATHNGHAAAIESQLIFVGLFGMIDPPRAEVKAAVATSRSAGIRPVMITGDHPLTARHIAHELGISTNGQVLTGQDLQQMSMDDLKAVVEEVSVYARVSPEHKLKIVQALQERGHIVAMTGDGVNDAPALKRANIGVAMGITGTDVSKEAADMVLRDDNFATIVAAIEEGRVIYDNIRKFVKFSIAGNIGKISVALFAPLLGTPLALQPLQLLWLNLLTDGLLGLGMGVEPAERGVMQRPPANPNDSILAGGLGRYIGWVGALTGALALLVGVLYWQAGNPHWQTMIFTTLCFAQIGQALATRSSRDSFFKLPLLSNRLLLTMAITVFGLQLAVIYVPFLQEFFSTTTLAFTDLLVSVGASVIVFAAIELGKWRSRRR